MGKVSNVSDRARVIFVVGVLVIIQSGSLAMENVPGKAGDLASAASNPVARQQAPSYATNLAKSWLSKRNKDREAQEKRARDARFATILRGAPVIAARQEQVDAENETKQLFKARIFALIKKIQNNKETDYQDVVFTNRLKSFCEIAFNLAQYPREHARCKELQEKLLLKVIVQLSVRDRIVFLVASGNSKIEGLLRVALDYALPYVAGNAHAYVPGERNLIEAQLLKSKSVATVALKLQKREPLDTEDAILLSNLLGTVLEKTGRMPEALKPLYDFVDQYKERTFGMLAKGAQAAGLNQALIDYLGVLARRD